MDRNTVMLTHLDPDLHNWLKAEAESRSDHDRVGRIPLYKILEEVLRVGRIYWRQLDNQARQQGVTTWYLIDQLEESEKETVTTDSQ